MMIPVPGLRGRRGMGSTTYNATVTALTPLYCPSCPASLPLAVMQAESSGNPTAVSPQGAQGLFQIMPANDKSLSITDPFDPNQNIAGGLTLLQQYYNQFGDWNLALQAYNGGPSHVTQGNVSTAAQQYASNVLSAAGIDTTDSTDPGPSDGSTGDDTQGDGSGFFGLSWGTAAAVGAGLLALALVTS